MGIIIVLEGADGSGKTTLQKHLIEIGGFDIGPRAVTSEGGVKDPGSLVRWVWDDLYSWRTAERMRVYDRYPLVSEYIYGPIIRGDVAPGMLSPFAKEMAAWFVKHALVIFCMPPLEVVKREVMKEEQMPGVVDKITDIYESYQLLMLNWQGPHVIFDWTSDSIKANDLVRYCKEREAKWN